MPHRSFFAAVLVLVSILVPGAARGGLSQEQPSWEAIGPFGGAVTSLVVSPSDPAVLYAGTPEAGIFRSRDGGRSWLPLRNGLPTLAITAVAVHPRNPEVVYAATVSRGVFKSLDGGATWSAANRGLPDRLSVSELLIDPAEPRRLYLIANGRVYRSLNQARSWTPAAPGAQELTHLALAPSSRQTLYAASFGGGFFKSTEFGATWVRVGDGPPVSPGGSIDVLAVDPRSPRTVYAGLSGRTGPLLFKSTDGGATWRPASQGLPAGVGVGELQIHATARGTLYAGTGQGVFKSLDGGRSWRPARAGLEEGLAVRALAIHPSVPSLLWAGTGTLGVYRSRDAGTSWLPSRQGLSGTEVTGMAVTVPDAPLYAATSNPGIVWVSRTGGRRWAPLRRGLRAEYTRSVAVSPLVPELVFAGTSEGAFRSTDGGATWVRRSRGLAPAYGYPFTVFALGFHPTDPDVLYAGGWDEIYTSTDRGETWRRTTRTPNVQVESIATSPADPDVVYAGGTAIFGEEDPLPYLFRSDDAGETWTPLDFIGSVKVAADPFDPATVLVGSGLGLFRSADRGQTFEEVDLSFLIPGVDIWAVAFAPASPGTAYAAGTEGGGGTVVLRSRDGGVTWESLDVNGLSGAEIRDLQVDAAGNVYVATRGNGIFRLAAGEL